jgi:hypothetical protein
VTARETAHRVLAWAAAPAGPPPSGPVDGVHELATADPRTGELVAELTRCTAARIGAGTPPFGDGGRVGPGAVMLAAAVGARLQPAVAERLVLAVPDGSGLADAVARHGVMRPVLPVGLANDTLPERLLDAVLRASPVTALAYRPARDRLTSGATAAETETALALLGQPRGRTYLATVLGRPVREAAVLTWRTRLLARLRHTHPDTVVEVYLAARLHHGAEWDALMTRAVADLSGLGLPEQTPLAIVRFWAPLAALDRSDGSRLRERPFLDGYRRVFRLLDRYRLTEAS